MTSEEWLGAAFACALVAVCCIAILRLRLSLAVRQLLCVALILRVVGAQLYYATFEWSAYGGGDYRLYFDTAVEYAERMARGDFGMFTDSSSWWAGEWHGTQFVFYVAAIIVTLIGPSLGGLFVAFGLLGFVGLLGFAVAFHRSTPDVPVNRYLAWVCLFPSLWFWPAAVGKDAILLMGLGLSVWGYVGKKGRIQWPILASGLFFVFAIRPEVAAVVIVSIVGGHMITRDRPWSGTRVVQTAAVVGAGLWILRHALASIGAEGFAAREVEDYVSARAAASAAEGGSTVATATGLGGMLIGLGNVLFRPLPWEVRNVAGLIASLEIWALWLVLSFHRRNAAFVLRRFRSNRLVAVGVPFVLLYAGTLGMAVANLGIIARQRIFLFPFLFLLLLDMQRSAARARSSRASRSNVTTQSLAASA